MTHQRPTLSRAELSDGYRDLEERVAALEGKDPDPLAGVPLVSHHARAAATDGELGAEDFAGRTPSHDDGFTVDDVREIVAERAGDDGQDDGKREDGDG